MKLPEDNSLRAVAMSGETEEPRQEESIYTSAVDRGRLEVMQSGPV